MYTWKSESNKQFTTEKQWLEDAFPFWEALLCPILGLRWFF